MRTASLQSPTHLRWEPPSAQCGPYYVRPRGHFGLIVFDSFRSCCGGFLDCARNDIVFAWLAAGRGRPALPWRYYARQGFVVYKQTTCGRTRNAPTTAITKVSSGIADLPAGAPCHRRLARRGSLPSPTCPRGLPAIADLPAGAPCHRRLARGGSLPCCLP